MAGLFLFLRVVLHGLGQEGHAVFDEDPWRGGRTMEGSVGCYHEMPDRQTLHRPRLSIPIFTSRRLIQRHEVAHVCFIPHLFVILDRPPYGHIGHSPFFCEYRIGVITRVGCYHIFFFWCSLYLFALFTLRQQGARLKTANDGTAHGWPFVPTIFFGARVQVGFLLNSFFCADDWPRGC